MNFKTAEFKDLLIQYKSFIENIYDAYSYLDYSIMLLKNFLNNHYKLKDIDEDFACELELILSYFEKYYQILFPIINELEQFSLSDKRKREELKLNCSNVHLFHPKYYLDEDIYVPRDYQIDWDYINK